MKDRYKAGIDYAPSSGQHPERIYPGQLWMDDEYQFEIASVDGTTAETTCGSTIPMTAFAEYTYLGDVYVETVEARFRPTQERLDEISEKSAEILMEGSTGNFIEESVPDDTIPEEAPAIGSQWLDSAGFINTVEKVYKNGGQWIVETDIVYELLDYFLKNFEFVGTGNSTDNLINDPMVHTPNHYLLFPDQSIEVKDICRAVMDNMDNSDMDVSSYEAGYIQQAQQYLLRFPGKGQWQDLEKTVKVLQFAIDSYKERSGQEPV